MKALKDCDWEVEIIDFDSYPEGFYWRAIARGDHGLEMYGHDDYLFMEGIKESKAKTKANWEKFAKLNEIKNYKIIGE